MCLTGLDYFSTLGYQPGIAALAAGLLSPVATVVLVALTLFGALPVYRRVATESPRGEGSIAMLERLLGFWWGKLFVLVLLGFAATDFIITMTLSAADATAHVLENPVVMPYLQGGDVVVTMVFLALLGAVFLRGFKDAIGVAVVLVASYLTLNLVVIAVALWQVATHPVLITSWQHAVLAQHGNPLAMVAIAIVVFPKLALGLSGFETGVAVMPHIQGAPGDTPAQPTGRIRGTKRLLSTAAGIMSAYLITSSIVTTLLIPPREFQTGGAAEGRALAYLAHAYLGNVFGTVYDVSTIVILWFAGASAMAGLLNLIPRYLPRYGMAPEFTSAVRPLVLILTTVALFITWVFDADVNAQGGAYATGVLVLFTSAGVAVTLAARRARQRWLTAGFAVITAVFCYTTADNIIERPDGVKIASCFIGAIVVLSLMSRVHRAFEPRAAQVSFDRLALVFLRDAAKRDLRLIAKEPTVTDPEGYYHALRRAGTAHDLARAGDVIFIEVVVTDPSEFAADLLVSGRVVHDQYRLLSVASPAVANAIASVLLAIRRETGATPHVYFGWTEGSPVRNLLRFLLFGLGEVASVTREVLRRAEPRPAQRPHVHVG